MAFCLYTVQRRVRRELRRGERETEPSERAHRDFTLSMTGSKGRSWTALVLFLRWCEIHFWFWNNGHVSVARREQHFLQFASPDKVCHLPHLAACGRAVDAWSVGAARIGVVKDIGILIGKLVLVVQKFGWSTAVSAAV
jgi:hypothetical protein